ncbi:ribulose-phosphate 3-epimerase [candidate division KSB3 bacterium]|uniref:Ribulose-phosphate 3-epimerase n=1 Tax=candidate division KSB3 bacterium TaxID=2044937 RepID=A0A9D5Q4U9_9BACT|nr:ribulose-phosphate 3-epimerase [candidate division KSB3 bacterium]MBD3323668.1 ribulose-phosphate 3-epimerase [candidate division KSB3 bacterium]
MTKIAPSILSADFACLKEEIDRAARGGADLLHIHVMDGHFVPNLTIGPPVVQALKKYTTLPLDVHLMMTNPEQFIERFAESGANYLTVHAEVCPHLHKTIHDIKQHGMKAGVSLNPATPVRVLDEILPDVDLILIMSVNPGFSGQTFIPSSLAKIQQLRHTRDVLHLQQLEIEVDGGISLANIREVVDAGATIIVAGSAIFKADDPAKMIQAMKAACQPNTP